MANQFRYLQGEGGDTLWLISSGIFRDIEGGDSWLFTALVPKVLL